MDFDPIKAGGDGIGGGLAEVVDDAGQLVDLQCARFGHINKAVVHERFGLRTDGRSGDGCGVAGLQIHVRDAAHVPELHEDVPATCVHGVGDLAPSVDLILRVEPGRVLVALGLGRDLGSLGDDQAGRGPLGVVAGRQRAGHQAGIGSVARQRCHHDTVGQRQRAKGVGLEQCRGRHLMWGWWSLPQ
ncbi:hypothetical protein D3C73_996870 [compost metagenome]